MHADMSYLAKRDLDGDEIARIARRCGDARVAHALNRGGTKVCSLTLPTKDVFLSLIWHEVDQCRILTPGGRRTLRDVIETMQRLDLSFEALALGRPPGHYSPTWFAPCVAMDTDFDWEQFGEPIVVSPNGSERSQSPSGRWYLFDGNHRALVLAKKVIRGELEYRPIDVHLLDPRPS